MKAYEFLFCDCIYESSYSTISLHKTKGGAFKAMNRYLNTKFQEELNSRLMYGKLYDHDDYWNPFKFQGWAVSEIEIED